MNRTFGIMRWQERLVWVHGDLASGNILVRDGKFSAVIDFGCMSVGDLEDTLLSS